MILDLAPERVPCAELSFHLDVVEAPHPTPMSGVLDKLPERAAGGRDQ